MILPTKHLRCDNSLLGIGAEILNNLGNQKAISSLWEDVEQSRCEVNKHPFYSYDWFILALDMLYMIGTIELNNGLVQRNITPYESREVNQRLSPKYETSVLAVLSNLVKENTIFENTRVTQYDTSNQAFEI